MDQLHAAFLHYQSESQKASDNAFSEGMNISGSAYQGFHYWPLGGWLLDLPYLLDVQLTGGELRDYLKRYAKPAKRMVMDSGKRRRNAFEMAEYSLAVRYARHEEYRKAGAIYSRVQAWPRAHRMRRFERLHGAANDPALTRQESLQAQYAYAAFLEEHSTQVFFIDPLWYGFRTWAFLGYGLDHPYGT